MPPEQAGVILNVNDDEATRYVLSRTLRRVGYDVWEASSGYEALMLARQSPRLTVLDVGAAGELARQSFDLQVGDAWFRVVTDPVFDEHEAANVAASCS